MTSSSFPVWAVRQREGAADGVGRDDSGKGGDSGGKRRGPAKGKGKGRGKVDGQVKGRGNVRFWGGKKGGGGKMKGKGSGGKKGDDHQVGAEYRDAWGGVYVDGGYIYGGVFFPCASSLFSLRMLFSILLLS
jgi:hypothetical protein